MTAGWYQDLPPGATDVSVHVNTEGERLGVARLTRGAFAGRRVLVLWDDPPPEGSGLAGIALLDEGTQGWLRTCLDGGTQ